VPTSSTETDVGGLTLRELTVDDACLYHQLVSANSKHLTKHGDYLDDVASTFAEVERQFSVANDLQRCFGIWLDDGLIGRVDLTAVAPPRYGFGFWVAECHEGRGYVTAAGRAALAVAATTLAATDVFAGVTHGNVRSERVLARLGFRRVEHFDRYARYHLSLVSG
jgi:RimJ/RimL family protein N-acetyltransferase